MRSCADYHGIRNEDFLLVGFKGPSFSWRFQPRRLTVPHRVDFIALSSYADKAEATGAGSAWIMDTRADVAGRHVLIASKTSRIRAIRSVTSTAFELASLHHCARRYSYPSPTGTRWRKRSDYLGFSIPDVWVVGYGLDFADRFRTLPYIAALKPRVYQK